MGNHAMGSCYDDWTWQQKPGKETLPGFDIFAFVLEPDLKVLRQRFLNRALNQRRLSQRRMSQDVRWSLLQGRIVPRPPWCR